jgi:hypothetical protein
LFPIPKYLIKERVANRQRHFDVTKMTRTMFTAKMAGKADAGCPVTKGSHPQIIEAI